MNQRLFNKNAKQTNLTKITTSFLKQQDKKKGQVLTILAIFQKNKKKTIFFLRRLNSISLK